MVQSSQTEKFAQKMRYLLASIVALGAAATTLADEVVDLGGASVTKTGAEFKTAYNNNTIENGTVTVSSAHDNENMASGVYTIGNGATLSSGDIHQNGDLTLTVAGGTYISTGYITMPFRYGNQVLVLDNGVLSHTSSATASGVPQTVNIGYTWNNKDSSKGKNISARAVVVNGSRFEMTQSGNLGLGMNKAHERKINTMKVDFAVTNSTVFVSNGQIVMSGTDNAWISDTANSYVHAVFGPGADLTFKQIYANGSYPAPSAIFDGATIHWVAGGNSFIGQTSSVSGDIYEIQDKGLTVDIPEGGALSCDVNSSALKGDGGIVKIGKGSITWNKITSSGSGRHLFTGPLIVSNGVWSSSVGYAASDFRVDGAGSRLALSGALESPALGFTATAGGTLDIAGATLADTTPELTLATGGSADYSTDGAVKTYTLGTLALGADTALKLTGDGVGVDTLSVDNLILSATAANPVSVTFSEAAQIPGGTYAILARTGDGAFAAGDLAKFTLDANVPDGAALALSGDGTALVLTVPVTNPATWTGAANDGNKFSTPGNWRGNAVPSATDDVVINVASETTLDCDLPFDVNSITIMATSSAVTISGTGSITNASKIANAAAARAVINVPVEFVAHDAYVPIDVTGEVDFQGGVKGTVPANHATFYGNYTLTASSWALSSAVTLAANATVTAKTIDLNGTSLLKSQAGSTLTANRLNVNVGGNMFGTFAGNLTVLSQLYSYQQGDINFNSGFSGVFRIKKLHYHSGGYAKDFTLNPAAAATLVIGGAGFEIQRGNLRLNGRTLRSSGDWAFDNTDSNYSGDDGAGHNDVGAKGIMIDTSDYDDPTAAGHTVSVNNTASKSANVLVGTGGVTVFGNGSMKFNKTAHFTGGLLASNGVTVAVNQGVYPGKGNVAINDAATLDLVQSGSGTVPVTGTLTLAGGATIRMALLAAGRLPVSANALAFEGVTAEKKVALVIDGGTLEDGYYALVHSATAIPDGAVDNFSFTLGESVVIPTGATTALHAQDNTIFLRVGDVSDLPSGVWVGGADGKMSTAGNWKNMTVPAVGSDLDFSRVAAAQTVNADIDGAFGTLTMGEKVITFTGALTADAFSDMSKVAVGENSTVTIDGDLEFSSGTSYIANKVGDGGAFVVTGKILATGSADVRPYKEASSGWIVAKGLENAETTGDKWNFRLNNSNVAKWVVGEDGFSGTQYFWSFNNANSDTTIKADADFTIATWLSVGTSDGKGVTFDTSGRTDPEANYTITANCGFVGVKPVTIKGGGTFLCDYTPTKIENHGAFSGAVTVGDTATLAINPGKQLTTGAITVQSGATLQVAQSGTVSLGGNLALMNNVCLAFNYTARKTPVLALDGRTVTFETGATTNVTVKVASADGLPPKSGKNVLTTGGKFADATVSLAEDSPEWALGLEVVDGNLVLNVKPYALRIFIR